jgi:TonB family protein
MCFTRRISALLLVVAASFACAPSSSAQASPQAATPVKIESYPDNVGGLKRLVKDIEKAQKENDTARAGALLDSLTIPNYMDWYSQNFDDAAAARVLPKYEVIEKSLSAQLAGFFLNAQTQGLNDVEVVRFEKDCDDNASEQTFNTLDARLKPFPLYELRLYKGDHFKRLFGFAYIDGGFRFILTPDFSDGPLRGKGPARNSNGEAGAPEPRIKQGGAMQAAMLVEKIAPAYPEIARNERLAGTVRLHAVIDKQGKIAELRVISGRCSLSKASVDAVRRWRYRPTLLNGNPVEVDTTIEVIFALNN